MGLNDGSVYFHDWTQNTESHVITDCWRHGATRFGWIARRAADAARAGTARVLTLFTLSD